MEQKGSLRALAGICEFHFYKLFLEIEIKRKSNS